MLLRNAHACNPDQRSKYNQQRQLLRQRLALLPPLRERRVQRHRALVRRAFDGIDATLQPIRFQIGLEDFAAQFFALLRVRFAQLADAFIVVLAQLGVLLLLILQGAVVLLFALVGVPFVQNFLLPQFLLCEHQLLFQIFGELG